VTLWVPVYGIEGLIKALTALASIVTAVILWRWCRAAGPPSRPSFVSPSRAGAGRQASARGGGHAAACAKDGAIGQLTAASRMISTIWLTIISGNMRSPSGSLNFWSEASRDR